MSNLEKTLYQILKDFLIDTLGKLARYSADGCTCDELLELHERVLHVYNMLDVVYGSIKGGIK